MVLGCSAVRVLLCACCSLHIACVSALLRSEWKPTQLIAVEDLHINGVSKLCNHKDIQFTLDVALGGQNLRVVPDTGSFALAVTSKRCSPDNCPKRAFDPFVSKTFKSSGKNKSVGFGSGYLQTLAGSDDLVLAGFHVQKQFFWEITEVDHAMRELWSQAEYDGILGLPWLSIVPGSNNQSTVSSALGVARFAVCLGRAGRWREVAPSGRIHELIPHNELRGTPSFIYWSDAGIQMRKSMTYLSVVGNQHWAVALHSISVSHGRHKRLNNLSMCIHQPCAAMIDTGSSEILAPPKHLEQILHAIGHVDRGCKNYGQLPELHLELGNGKGFGDGSSLKVVLSPRAYVKRLLIQELDEARLSSNNDSHGNVSRQERLLDSYEICQLRLSSNTVVGDDTASVWILGVPFLQEHVVEFDRSQPCAKIGIAAHAGICLDPSRTDAKKHASGGPLGALSLDAELTAWSPVRDFSAEAQIPADALHLTGLSW